MGEMFREEQTKLRSFPTYPFETAKCTSVRVNAFSTIRFGTNNYSVSVEYTGRTVGVKGFAEKVEVYADGKLIYSYVRYFGKHQSVYKLEHYLPEDVLGQLRVCELRERIRIFRQYCGSLKPETLVVRDVVPVRVVELRRYDVLTGNAVNTDVRLILYKNRFGCMPDN